MSAIIRTRGTQRRVKTHQKQRPGAYESPCLIQPGEISEAKYEAVGEWMEKLFVFGGFKVN